VPFEAAWMKRIRAANPEMPILDLREAVELRPQQAHDHETDPHQGHAHGHQGDEALDPHIWTSPRNAIRMTAAIRDALSALDPAGASGYAARQRAYAETLAALDAELEATLADLEHRSFLVYHPAWGYFADAYGLEQIPIEAAGKEPGPKRLTALIEQARAAGSRVIFVQPQFDRRAAAQVAKTIGGRVETADPLAAEYADSLRRFARLIAKANAPADAARRPEPAE
jgi:zinc transport system substrate-binding protein